MEPFGVQLLLHLLFPSFDEDDEDDEDDYSLFYSWWIITGSETENRTIFFSLGDGPSR